MPTYVRARGLARKGVRIRSKLAGGSAVTLTGRGWTLLDLDDPNTRADVAHHSSIGQILVGGNVNRYTTAPVAVVDSGCVVTPRQGSLVLDVSAGTVRLAANTTQAVTATTVTLGAAPATAGQKRVDLVQVRATTGAVTLVAGTAGPGAVAPAVTTAGTDIALAYVLVEANATQPTYVDDVRPLP
jgi:hypothetical protein